FESDRQTFMANWSLEDAKIRDQILAARAALGKVATPDKSLRDCAELCIALGSDGLRGELTLLKAARALAAWRGEKRIARKHLKEIAPAALRHRLRRDPLDEAGSTTRVERTLEEVLA
ncbi:MAG: magnesium chelatase ATPase subunit I, partial [Pseudomonadota bacterium]